VAQVELNGKSLGDPKVAGTTPRYDVTGQLAPRNELCIVVDGAANGLGEVRLEIEDGSSS
jgi:hypothetical protein